MKVGYTCDGVTAAAEVLPHIAGAKEIAAMYGRMRSQSGENERSITRCSHLGKLITRKEEAGP